MTDRQTREVNIRVANAERSRTNRHQRHHVASAILLTVWSVCMPSTVNVGNNVAVKNCEKLESSQRSQTSARSHLECCQKSYFMPKLLLIAEFSNFLYLKPQSITSHRKIFSRPTAVLTLNFDLSNVKNEICKRM